MALSIAKSAASVAKRPHRGTCIRLTGSPNRGGMRINSPHQVIYWSPADLPAIAIPSSGASTLPKLLNCRKSSSSRAVSSEAGAFFTGRKLARLRSVPTDFTAQPDCLLGGSGATSLFFHQAQRRMQWLWLGRWRRGEDNSGFKQKFAYLLPYKIAHPGGGDIPCEQLDRMRPRPFSLLVGALTAGPTAEGWPPAAGSDLEPLFADGAARSFAPPPFWLSGCHPRRSFRWVSSDITPVTK
jgi:hypothetical protein